MFGAHKETFMLAAIIVALVTCLYLYNEHKKTKADIAAFKSLAARPPPPPPPQPQVKARAKVVEPEPEPESED